MKLPEFLELKSRQWKLWRPHPQFELFGLGILRDLESRLHAETSRPRSVTSVSPALPQGSELRTWLSRRPLPQSIEDLLVQGNSPAAAPIPRGASKAEAETQRAELPLALTGPSLLATDRLWEKSILETGARFGATLLSFDIELQLQGLGVFEASSRDWALDQGWVAILAETAPDSLTPSSQTFLARWYWVGLSEAQEPALRELCQLPGAIAHPSRSHSWERKPLRPAA